MRWTSPPPSPPPDPGGTITAAARSGHQGSRYARFTAAAPAGTTPATGAATSRPGPTNAVGNASMTPRGAAHPPATHPAVPGPPHTHSSPRPARHHGRSRPRQSLRLALLLCLLLVVMVAVPALVLALAPTAHAEDWSPPPGDGPTSQVSEDSGDGGLPVRQPDAQDLSPPAPAAAAPDL